MTRARALLVAALVAVAATTAGYAVDAVASGADDHALGPGVVTVDLDIQHSHFSIDQLRVHAGTIVRFVVHNHDPISHELIVGGPDVHARHARGTEQSHPPIPGEVSVGPQDVGETFYRFDDVGSVVFACHLPRHFEYGMHGTVTVV